MSKKHNAKSTTYHILTKRIAVELHNAWMDFDNTTAYGCQQRDRPYDIELNKNMWNTYNNVIFKYFGCKCSSPFGE